MNKQFLAASVVSIAAISTAVYLHYQLQAERQHSASLESTIAELQSRARQRSTVVDRPVSPPAVVAPRPVAAKQPDDNGTTNVAPPPRRGPGWNNNFRGIPNDPESRAAMRAQQKRRLMEAYPDLAAALHLRPDEIDRLFDLLAEQQMQMLEQRESLRSQNLSREEMLNEMRRIATEQDAERDRQVASLLGDDKAHEWQSYQNSLGARAQIRELGTLLESSGLPLRDDQTQVLIDALVAQQNRNASEQRTGNQNIGFIGGLPNGDPNRRIAMLEQNLAQQEKNYQQTHDTLAPYLTPQQLKRYEEISSQQLEYQRLNAERIRQRIANGQVNRN